MSKTKIFGLVLLFIAAIITISLGTLGYRYLTAEVKGRVGAEEQIEGAASRIQRYQEFFNICQGIQAKEDAIDNLGLNDTMADSGKGAAITANQNARSTLIAEYNSKASQSYTSGRFRDSDLPYQIPRGPYTGDNKTNCSY